MATHGSTDRLVEELWLLGQPPLDEFVDFIKMRSPQGRSLDDGEFIDRWRAAADVYATLAQAEAGDADRIVIREVPDACRERVQTLSQDPRFRKTFSSVPIAFGLVELDRLVVYQRDLTLTSCTEIAAALGPDPSEEHVAELCLPIERPLTRVAVGPKGSDGYVFHAASHDLRFLGAQLLPPEALAADRFVSHGHVVGVVALLVGFGGNYLNAVKRGSRLVLNNGYHRAYALRSLGVEYAPCVIQAPAHGEELAYAGASEIADHSSLYFEHARPPLLRDFFDDRLTIRVRTPPLRRHVQVSYDVESMKIPE
jgi:hypothetical protein